MHRAEMSGTRLIAASAIALAAGCGTETVDGFNDDRPRTGLLALARADAVAPAPAVTAVAVRYDQGRTAFIRHPDAGTTVFVELFFPPQAILHVGGQPVCGTCTVNVTVTTTPGVYGFTLTPSTMIFNASSTPTATFTYGTYGDLSVHDSSSLYATPQAFDAALGIWYEVSPGQWRAGRNSTHIAAGRVTSGIETPGAHLLAAPK
jgi:hypothetical protein